jgi:hypothetical protein
LATLLIIIALCHSVASAFDPIGPPAARLKEGWSATTLEYLYSSMDLETDSFTLGPILFSSSTIKNIKSNKFYANFASSLQDYGEVFLRMGAMDASPDTGDNRGNWAGFVGDSDYEFTVGAGAKFNFGQSQDGAHTWSLVAQTSYASMDLDVETNPILDSSATLSAELNIWEVQIALGYTRRFGDRLWVYCGPFLHYVSGDADIDGSIDTVATKASTDLEQDSNVGGYIGAEWSRGGNFSFCVEWQFTGGGHAFGGGLIWRFE